MDEGMDLKGYGGLGIGLASAQTHPNAIWIFQSLMVRAPSDQVKIRQFHLFHHLQAKMDIIPVPPAVPITVTGFSCQTSRTSAVLKE
jgi:hypothetical protein